MRIKEDAKLAYIATSAKRPITEMSRIIAQALHNNGLIRDDKENYGQRLVYCIDEEAAIATVVYILKGATGLDKITCDVFDAFCGCTLIGDGDCPKCGGTMECVDSRGRDVGDAFDPYSQPEHVNEWEQWRCPLCGYTHEIEY